VCIGEGREKKKGMCMKYKRRKGKERKDK